MIIFMYYIRPAEGISLFWWRRISTGNFKFSRKCITRVQYITVFYCTIDSWFCFFLVIFVPEGCRGAIVVAEARSADEPVLTRRCIIMKVPDFTTKNYLEAHKQKAAAILLLLPKNISSVAQEAVQVTGANTRNRFSTMSVLFICFSPSWWVRVQPCRRRPSYLCMWCPKMSSCFTCMKKSSKRQPPEPPPYSSEVNGARGGGCLNSS